MSTTVRTDASPPPSIEQQLCNQAAGCYDVDYRQKPNFVPRPITLKEIGLVNPFGVSWTKKPGLEHFGGRKIHKIKLLRDTKTGQLAVRKSWTFRRDDCETQSVILNEILLTRRFCHDSVVMFVMGWTDLNTASLYTEYCNMGTLQDFKWRLASHGAQLSQNWMLYFLDAIASAILYLQTGLLKLEHADDEAEVTKMRRARWSAIFHGDIRTDQGWLTSVGCPNTLPAVKLGDFGRASRIDFYQFVKDTTWMPHEA